MVKLKQEKLMLKKIKEIFKDEDNIDSDIFNNIMISHVIHNMII